MPAPSSLKGKWIEVCWKYKNTETGEPVMIWCAGEVIGVADGADSDALSALNASIGAANLTVVSVELGATVTQATAAQIQVFTEQQSVTCAKGYWCSAALAIECTPNTYNNLTNQMVSSACGSCRPYAHTEQEASTSLEDCLCDEGFSDTIIGPGVNCSLCPSGTDCKGGATLGDLGGLGKLAPGGPTMRQLIEGVGVCISERVVFTPQVMASCLKLIAQVRRARACRCGWHPCGGRMCGGCSTAAAPSSARPAAGRADRGA